MEVQIKDIYKAYGDHQALNGVSMDIPEGSIFGLLGPNGAGKTSLIRILNQITAPDSGQILLNGAPLKKEDVHRIGYLPEERGLYKKMAVGEQATYLARLKGLDRSEARTALKYWFERFEIQDWWGKKVEELSKGMAQKIQFITTILHEPQLLIFDEPFSGFDPINAELIKNEILELNRKGTTILFSTHRMESVELLCQHIALINRSQVILSGSLEDIRDRYRDRIYAIVLQMEEQKKTELPEGSERIDEHQKGQERHLKVRLAEGMQTDALLQKLMLSGRIERFEEVIPTVNEIFIKSVSESHE